MMDKLFDGSDAHLLPGNANQRIAELEAAMVGWRADQKENIATAVEECKRANEAERKLDVAREALKKANHFHDYDDVLAQIGGDNASQG